MKAVLVALVALLWGGPAAAWIHGIPTINMAANMGARDKAGFGGIDLSGNPGVWTVETVVNDDTAASCSGNTSCDLTVDGWNQLTSRGTYGSAPAWGTPPSGYHVTLNNGVARMVVAVTVVPAASYVRSHYDATATYPNRDSKTSFQLKTVLETSTLPLGTTVYMRDGSGTTGTTPGLNPFWLYNQDYAITVPVSGGVVTYPGSGEIEVRSENPTTGNDSNGNPWRGGGAQIGELKFATTGCADVYIPVHLKYVTFYNNIPSTGGHNTGTGDGAPSLTSAVSMYRPSVCGYGGDISYSRFELGPAIPDTQIVGNGIFAIAGNRWNMDHNHFKRVYIGVDTGSSGNPPYGSHTGGPYAACTGTPATSCTTMTLNNNTFEETQVDVMEFALNTADYQFNDNLAFNVDSRAGVPENAVGDGFTISDAVGGTSRTYTYVAAPDSTQGHIPLGTRPILDVVNAVCTIQGGGTITIVPQNTTASTSFACVEGVNYPTGGTADPSATAYFDGKNGGGTWNAVLTPLVAGRTITVTTTSALYNRPVMLNTTTLGTPAKRTVNWAPNHPDTFQFFGFTTASTYVQEGKRNISVRSALRPNTGSDQFIFNSTGTNLCCVVGTFKNNISALTQGNIIYQRNYAAPTDTSFNTGLNDVTSNAWDPSDPSFDFIDNPTWGMTILRGVLSVLCDSAATGTTGGTWSHNLMNGFGLPCQTTPTITPDPNEMLNFSSTGDTAATVFSRYTLVMPNWANGSHADWLNRPTIIAANVPARGTAFTGSLSSSCVLTSATRFDVNTKVNGPGIATPVTGMSSTGGHDPIISSWDSYIVSVTGPSGGVYTHTLQMSGHLTCTTQTNQTYATGAMNPDGTYNGALFPTDDFGDAGWNDGTVFDPTQHHTPAT